MKKQYDNEFKMRAVQLSEEIGASAAMRELGLANSTFYGWLRKYKNGVLDPGEVSGRPEQALTLAEQVKQLQKEVKRQGQELKEKEQTIEMLKEASIFFAQGQKK